MTEIHISGAVQGVGFRPTVYAVARRMMLRGTVENCRAGVIIRTDADETTARRLVDAVRPELPPAARIDRVEFMPLAEAIDCEGFEIVTSSESGDLPADLTPDIAICPDCLADILAPGRRHGYPLTNCTRCGPRFSIVTALPYDRRRTTMSRFPMCPDCRREYDDPADRRHHAQPTACNVCGPTTVMTLPDGTRITDLDRIADTTAELLRRGEIVISKSLGGYNMLADASSESAIARLRDIKRRPRKPLAVMAADLATARRLASVGEAEASALASWRAPIVVLDGKTDLLPDIVAPGCRTLGVMLPYMALQHAICRRGVVMAVTSANRPGEPIITDDDEAAAYARELAMPVISYNREIANRLDDSLVRIAPDHDAPLIMRRSRGFAPEPLRAGRDCSGVMGVGADIISQWAMGRGYDIIQSPYIGSLRSEGTERSFLESFDRLSRLYGFRPELIVSDMHPDYTSTRLAREIAASTGARLVAMQHHHAHAVSVMADLGLTERVLALVLDGTGYGTDGTVWGSELMTCDRISYTRIDHGPLLPMPGGDMAAREPWRMAAAWIWQATGSLDRVPDRLRTAVSDKRLALVGRMMERSINSPLTAGAGRLFDAVSALLGLAYNNGYEAEAPILLEGAARGTMADPYTVDSANPLDLRPLLLDILSDIDRCTDPTIIAARFHATYARVWTLAATAAAERSGLTQIVLSGGVLANSLLCRHLLRELRAAGLQPLMPRNVTPGDGCIAVGQAAFGAELIYRSHLN